jgi:hypothetical protein
MIAVTRNETRKQKIRNVTAKAKETHFTSSHAEIMTTVTVTDSFKVGDGCSIFALFSIAFLAFHKSP